MASRDGDGRLWMTSDMTNIVTLLIPTGNQATLGDAAATSAGGASVPFDHKCRCQKVFIGSQMQVSFLTGHIQSKMDAPVAIWWRIDVASASVTPLASLTLLRRWIVVYYVMADQMAFTGNLTRQNDVVVGQMIHQFRCLKKCEYSQSLEWNSVSTIIHYSFDSDSNLHTSKSFQVDSELPDPLKMQRQFVSRLFDNFQRVVISFTSIIQYAARHFISS